MARKHREIGKAGWGYTAMTSVIGFIYFFPVLWIILTAFKTRTDALAVPPKLFFTPTLDNFTSVFYRASITTGSSQATDMGLYFFNSIFIAGTSVGLALIVGTLAAYAFSRFPLRGNDTYLFIILTTRMMPPIVVIIPIFLMFVFGLILTWNEFLFALLLTGVETRTVPVAMARTLGGEVGVDYGLLAAIVTLFLIPIFFVTFLLQNQLLRGVTFGTVKK